VNIQPVLAPTESASPKHCVEDLKRSHPRLLRTAICYGLSPALLYIANYEHFMPPAWESGFGSLIVPRT